MTAPPGPAAHRARPDRWQPHRAGLVNVWRYAEEVFTFHEGRLLLRGANGSGKSMALELLFPFLLDANAQPGRLSSASKARGGLYDRLMTGLDGRDRVGFLWAEFSPRAPGGADPEPGGGGDGRESFTIGVRLRGSSATHKVDYAWFTTSLAVGRQLRLFDEQRIPLSRAGLEDALAGAGTVHASADDYRRAVRAALFPGCDERQYDAVITTLLALRREKISQDLNPEKLSGILTASLPPLDEYDIAEVAEGFEKLERRKDNLARLEADLDQVRRLGRRQRAYARAVMAGVANAVRSAATRRDDVTRRARLATEELDRGRAEVDRVEADDAAAARRTKQLEAEVDGLKSLDAYRAGGQIEVLRGEADRAGRRAREEADTARARQADAEAREVALGERRVEAETATRAVGRAGAELATAADAAGALAVVGEAEALTADDAETLLAAWTEARRRELAEVRAALVRHARAVDDRERADGALEQERAGLDAAAGRRDEADTGLGAAVDGYTASVSAWMGSCAHLDADELRTALPSPPHDPRAVTAAVHEVAGAARAAAAVGADRLAGAIAVGDDEVGELTAERAEVAAGRVRAPDPPPWRSPRPGEALGAPFWRLVDVADGARPEEIDAVEGALLAGGLLDAWVAPDGHVRLPTGAADVVLAPDGPRATTSRSLAALLVPAQVDHLPVPPDLVRRLLDRIGLVDSVVPAVAGAPPPGPTDCGAATAAGQDDGAASGAAPAAVTAVAAGAGISAGASPGNRGADRRADHRAHRAAQRADREPERADRETEQADRETERADREPEQADRETERADREPEQADRGAVVGLDGTFRLGPLVGRGPAHRAAHIGAAAQEQRRARRLAEIDGRLAELGRRRAGLERELADLRRRQAALDAEAAAAPRGEPIELAERALAVAEERVADARARVERADQARSRAETVAREAQRQLMHLAAASGMPTEAAGLEEYDRRLRATERLALTWTRRRRELAGCERQARRAEEEAARAADEEARAQHRRDDAVAEHGELAARLAALEETLGAEYREVVERIRRAVVEMAELGERRARHGRRLRELAGEIGRLGADLDKVEAERLESEAQRQEAHAAFLAAAGDGLLADADIEVRLDPAVGDGPGLGAVLDAARAVAQVVGERADHDRRTAEVRLQEALHQARQSLAGGIELVLDEADLGWLVLRAVSDGLRHRIGELARGLAGTLAAAREELRDEEQRLFDETLTGSVRRAVAERIRRSNGLVDGINSELAPVRTAAAGVGVRLRWEVDPDQPDAVKAARRLLLKDPADLTDAERASLYDFFRARLDDARLALDGTAGWEDRLRDALDYRRWHRFALEVAHHDSGGFVPATANRLARLSTGERSVVLHLPMLASVAAHYDGLGTVEAPSACPRLILLDELFAGVDVANRGQLFALFVTWDLDAVVTSDHEWCAYSSLDGIAIHHLHGADPGEPVTTSRFVWDGTERRVASLAVVGG